MAYPPIELLKQIYTPDELDFLTYELSTSVHGEPLGVHGRSSFSDLPAMLNQFDRGYGSRYGLYTLLDPNQAQMQISEKGIELTISQPNIPLRYRNIPDIDIVPKHVFLGIAGRIRVNGNDTERVSFMFDILCRNCIAQRN